MKTILLLVTTLLLQNLYSQQEFTVEIEALTVTNAPNIHSFSFGKTTDGKWLIIGGRIEGLHQRQPFAAFGETDNNKDVFVIDPINNQVWSKSLSSLSSSIFEQLQSTNQEFHQRGNTLYVIGGYGYSAFLNDHITYPNLTAIDVDGLANAVILNTSISSYFRQIADNNLAVTGGQIGYKDDVFYLCGGQLFEGRYNPMGPNNGPGFTQQYTDAVRKFKIVDNGTTMSIANYTNTTDAANLHRRDYNMSPQIFPNGEKGFTMFSGVFDANDLPFLNPVDVKATGHTVNSSFSQYLSHYHSAKTPIWDSINSTMHTVFFGGISQYTMDTEGVLTQDDDVPFVKTISVVSRKSDGTMEEKMLDIEMPTLQGAGAEFIPISSEEIYLDNEIVKLNNISDRTLVGYIYGGIESTGKNIFFSNNGTQSTASSKIYEVYISNDTQNTTIVKVNKENNFNLQIYPNPSIDNIILKANFSNFERNTVTIYDVLGKQVKSQKLKKMEGIKEVKIDISGLTNGTYFLMLKNRYYASKKKFSIF